MTESLLKCPHCDRLHFEVLVTTPPDLPAHSDPCRRALTSNGLQLTCRNCSAVLTVEVDFARRLIIQPAPPMSLPPTA